MKKIFCLLLVTSVLAIGCSIPPASAATDGSENQDNSYFQHLLQSLGSLREILNDIAGILKNSSSSDDGSISAVEDELAKNQAAISALENLNQKTADLESQRVDLEKEYPALLGDSGAAPSGGTDKKDSDEDGVSDAQDKCPKSAADGSGLVNLNSMSDYYGCNCSQIQAKGGFQPTTTCPGNTCDGPLIVTYQQQPGSCNNGNVTSPQCVAVRAADQGCNEIYQQQLRQKAQEDAKKAQQEAQKQQMIQQAAQKGMEMLKQLMEQAAKPDQGGQCQKACQCSNGEWVPQSGAANCCNGNQIKPEKDGTAECCKRQQQQGSAPPKKSPQKVEQAPFKLPIDHLRLQ